MNEPTASEISVDLGNRGKYDKRNRLNDLTGKEWLTLSTTIWPSKSAKYGVLSKEDVIKLVSFFSKERSKVLLIGGNLAYMCEGCNRFIRKIEDTHVGEVFDYILLELPHENSAAAEHGLLPYIAELAKFLNSALAMKRYVTIIFEEPYYSDANKRQLELNGRMEENGFVFKGKVNLIFDGGVYCQYNEKIRILNRHVFLMHFKKVENVDLSSAEIEILLKAFQSETHYSTTDLAISRELGEQKTSVWPSLTRLDEIGKLHPAPFSYLDVEKLVRIFTNPGEHVLDPFVGVASTLIACGRSMRKGTGIDLNNDYIELGQKRVAQFLFASHDLTLIHGDAIVELPKLSTKFDYCVTSPPYHNILRNLGGGVRNDNSQFRQGVKYYSESENDLGNQKDFKGYVSKFTSIMSLVRNCLREKAFCSIVISDFTVQKRETGVTSHIIDSLTSIGFKYVGTILLVQSQKAIYPFGYPYDFVINHVNQYVLNFMR